MAGIGFELSKILDRDSYSGLLRAYTYAAVLSSGAWVFSIIVIMFIIWFVQALQGNLHVAMQFGVSVTYLMAGSLIFSGIFQHSFTRFVADMLYEKKSDLIASNLMAVVLVLVVMVGFIGILLCYVLIPGESVLYQVGMLSSFIVLNVIWIGSNLLSGLKKYKAIVALFVVAYLVLAVTALRLFVFGLEGLMAAFYLGQFILMAGILLLFFREFPPTEFIRWDFFTRKHLQWKLVFSCVFLNLGIWADKFVFWSYPTTGVAVVGHLKMAQIYDFPMFLALLTLTPGLAMFLLRVETHFARDFQLYFDSVQEGGTLSELQELLSGMVSSAKEGIYDVMTLQTVTIVFVILFASNMMSWFHLSPFYVSLLQIDTVSAALLVLLLCLFNLLFYSDKLMQALVVSILFVVMNTWFTLLSLKWGVYYYGYGFAVSLLCSCLVALYLLKIDFKNFVFNTFMNPARL